MTKHPYKAYANATVTVAKTRQVIMLYDAAIRYIQQAKDAIEKKDIETRFKTITKATNIVFGLQGCLDFEQGGEVAETLYSFYSSIDARLLTIHRNNSTEMCDQIIKELKLMRDAWEEIDQGDTDIDTPSPDQIAADSQSGSNNSGIAISA